MTLGEYIEWYKGCYGYPPRQKCIESFKQLHPVRVREQVDIPEDFWQEGQDPRLPMFKFIIEKENVDYGKI